MKSRLSALFGTNTFSIIEVALSGLFFVQALRFLVGALYSRTSSASVYSSFPEALVPPNTLGLVTPQAISSELTFLGVVLAVPLLLLILGRLRFMPFVVVILMAVSRVLMLLPDAPINAVIASQWVVMGGIMCIILLVMQRGHLFPYFFVLGFALDQVIRSIGNTQDPSLSANYLDLQSGLYIDYLSIQIGLSIAMVIFYLLGRWLQSTPKDSPTPSRSGVMTLWGGIGFGALLFLQVSLLALPNAVTGRTNGDYALFAPLLILATLAPLVPWVRRQARALIASFETQTRGWIWLILMALLMIVGVRIQRVSVGGFEFQLGAFTLTLAQLGMNLLWWWFVRPKGERERNFSGLWVVIGALLFGMFIVFDLFTYDYAFVRNFAPPLDTLNAVIPPLLRGFRGLGLGIILLASFFAVLPMLQSKQAIPWVGGKWRETLTSLFITVVFVGVGAYYAQPIAVIPTLNVDEVRVATYNIHAGYSEFYDYNLEGIAQSIIQSGADVVLLQEVERGRLTSFGVDQSLWLARRLKMDRRFYATNEGLLGLAVLSKVPIVFDDGALLPSLDQQTGLQRVQIRPDEGTITLYNTLLGLLLEGETIEDRERNQQAQLSTIFSIIETHIERDYNGQVGRMILGGTFHNIPDSQLIDQLRQTGFTDPFAGTTPLDSATLVRLDRQARIDYLWIWAGSLRSSGRGVILDNPASDHRIAFIGIEIR